MCINGREKARTEDDEKLAKEQHKQMRNQEKALKLASGSLPSPLTLWVPLENRPYLGRPEGPSLPPNPLGRETLALG